MSNRIRALKPRRDTNTVSAAVGVAAGESVPVAGLSIHDPVFLGTDENGATVTVGLPYRNLLAAGEPGGGKSVCLNNIVGHAALCADARLWLFDGKQVELGPWASAADVFVGNNPVEANQHLGRLQELMDACYDHLAQTGKRKLTPGQDTTFRVCVVDEIAYYSATAGTKKTQDEFAIRLRDLVARGRAAGIIVIAATQRPSADIIPTSLRDLFGYRCAFRCTTDTSSDIILGHGWASEGYSAKAIAPEDRGVGWLLAEGGLPRRFKGAYLTDTDISTLVQRAAWIRTRTDSGEPADGRPEGVRP
jgi:DNA segregation ATPase FtsK/SpoIIIE, S-DNA-T family